MVTKNNLLEIGYLLSKSNKNIAIFGEMCSGKSYLANIINSYNENSIIVSLAKELKNFAKIILKREIDKNIDRELLQLLGKFGRSNTTQEGLIYKKQIEDKYGSFNENDKILNWLTKNSQFLFNENCWIDILFENLKNIIDLKHQIIIDDGRFINEAKQLRKRKFLIVKIIENEEERAIRRNKMYPNTTNNILNDISEREIPFIVPDLTISDTSIKDGTVNNFLLKL